MQFPIVLNSTPSSHKFLEQKFALSAKEAKSMMPELAKLERGEAYVLVDNEMVVAELCK